MEEKIEKGKKDIRLMCTPLQPFALHRTTKRIICIFFYAKEDVCVKIHLKQQQKPRGHEGFLKQKNQSTAFLDEPLYTDHAIIFPNKDLFSNPKKQKTFSHSTKNFPQL